MAVISADLVRDVLTIADNYTAEMKARAARLLAEQSSEEQLSACERSEQDNPATETPLLNTSEGTR